MVGILIELVYKAQVLAKISETLRFPVRMSSCACAYPYGHACASKFNSATCFKHYLLNHVMHQTLLIFIDLFILMQLDHMHK